MVQGDNTNCTNKYTNCIYVYKLAYLIGFNFFFIRKLYILIIIIYLYIIYFYLKNDEFVKLIFLAVFKVLACFGIG